MPIIALEKFKQSILLAIHGNYCDLIENKSIQADNPFALNLTCLNQGRIAPNKLQVNESESDNLGLVKELLDELAELRKTPDSITNFGLALRRIWDKAGEGSQLRKALANAIVGGAKIL